MKLPNKCTECNSRYKDSVEGRIVSRAGQLVGCIHCYKPVKPIVLF